MSILLHVFVIFSSFRSGEHLKPRVLFISGIVFTGEYRKAKVLVISRIKFTVERRKPHVLVF